MMGSRVIFDYRNPKVMPEEERRWLRSLTNRMMEKEEISRLLENYAVETN